MRLDYSTPVILIAIAETLIWAALFYIFPILLLRWEADFGWSRSEIALAFTLALGVSAAASPYAGRLIDQGRSRILFPAAALLGAAALCALAAAETRFVFFAAWAMIGLACAACLYEPCFAFLTRAKGVEARGAITTVTLAAGFASTLCYPVAETLAAAYGWRVAVLAFAGVAAFVAAPLFAIGCAMLETSDRGGDAAAEDGASRAAARAALRRPVFWLIAAAFPALALAHAMTISHLMPILADRGVGPDAAILAASLIGPCQVLGRIAVAYGAREKSAATIALLSFAAVSAAMVLLWAGRGEAVVFVAVVLFGAGYGVISIARPLVAADFLGRAGFGGISGALALPYIAAAAAAPTVAALLWSAGGYDLVLALCAGLAVFAIVLVSAASRRAANERTR